MSVKNWDTYQKHEIVKGTVPSLEPKKVHKIRETAPEGWTNIEDYDPNPKIIEETKVEEIKKEEPKVEHDEKKYIFYQGRWLTFEEYGKLWEPSEKKAEPKLEYLHDKKPNFLKRIFKRKKVSTHRPNIKPVPLYLLHLKVADETNLLMMKCPISLNT
jgi:hypothetical protein